MLKKVRLAGRRGNLAGTAWPIGAHEPSAVRGTALKGANDARMSKR